MPLHQIPQITESHCGPAVIEMLLDALGISFSQQQIAHAARVEDTIEEYGTLVEQLALATTKLAPETQFWYKYQATLDDIRYILHRGYGVGVEWQGMFYDDEEEEEANGDYGHYSVISHIDENKGSLVIIDPYKYFTDQTRIISIQKFLHRWWDTNEVIDPVSGKQKELEDLRLLFFITPFYEGFPKEHGFKAFSG